MLQKLDGQPVGLKASMRSQESKPGGSKGQTGGLRAHQGVWESIGRSGGFAVWHIKNMLVLGSKSNL